ncbi:helix-turn-helix domain-containing protein [Yaniella halotolerans]|uniref:helix-turn-helix domain-containing protein n=1 Tax=Yaniella halotolerans TaxID=225453 RepID=UPI0003B55385|nr:PucR family transcriptional regulator ligand-binding domain-containing protein [Yaniella halotolerans]
MLKLNRVLRDPELGLKVLTNPPVDDQTLSWAHVSELRDPTPWLVGGELLLTTGLTLFLDDEETQRYCERLADHNIAALGLSTGSSLAHNEPPKRLLNAAHDSGLTLIKVPENTPLQAVVRHVSDAISERDSEPLKRALVAQRQLSEAAVKPNGVASVLQVLDANTGFSSALYDPTFQLITATKLEPQDVFDQHREEVRKQIRSNNHWSISTDHNGEYSVIAPLHASDNLRGIMVTVKEGPLSEQDQAILSTVFSLLQVLLELRYTASRDSRLLRSTVVQALVEQQLSQTEAELHLARVNVSAAKLQCLLLPSSPNSALINTILSELNDYCSEILLWETDKDVLALICDPHHGIEEIIATASDELDISPGGLGATVNITEAGLSFRQASRARKIAEDRKESMVVFPHLNSYHALTLLGDDTTRAVFADTILQPLDDHDNHHGSELLQTLRAYLDAVGNIEKAADHALIHRHTMRARLTKISELTKRDLKIAPDLLELWLAVEFREV